MLFKISIFFELILYIIVTAEPRNFREKLNVVLERATIQYYDKEFIADPNAIVERKSRKDGYLLNFNVTFLHAIHDNVTFSIINYVYQSNVYRESIIRVEETICVAIKNIFVLTILKEYSNLPEDCPIVGSLYLRNMVIDFKNLPIDFPNSRQRFDFCLYQNEVKRGMGCLQIYAKFEHTMIRLEKKKNKPKA